MKTTYEILIILLLSFGCNNKEKLNPKYNDSKNDTIQTRVYYLDYFYNDEPEKILRSTGTKREVYPDGSFCLLNFIKEDSINYNYKRCYDEYGNPLGNGTSEKFEYIYKDKLELSFREKDTLIFMNTKELIDPTQLWFWKKMPKSEDSIVVNGVRKNFITNSIDLISTYYIYLGKEKLKIGPLIYDAHKVKNRTLGKQENVYDERWYDDKGMLIKELHYVGTDGLRIGVLNK